MAVVCRIVLTGVVVAIGVVLFSKLDRLALVGAATTGTSQGELLSSRQGGDRDQENDPGSEMHVDFERIVERSARMKRVTTGLKKLPRSKF